MGLANIVGLWWFKLAVGAMFIASLFVGGCIHGESLEVEKRRTLEEGYRVATAQVQARNEERQRAAQERIKNATTKYQQAVAANDRRAAVELNRVPEFTRGSGMPTTGSTTTCEASRSELLGYRAAVVRLAQSAANCDAGIKALLEGR